MKNYYVSLLLVLFCVGCSNPISDCATSSTEAPSSNHISHEGVTINAPAQTLDDLLAGIAKDVPGFGGFYFDGSDLSGTLNIYFTEPSSESADKARDKLASLFQQGQFVTAPVRAIQGRYDYIELLSWYRRVQEVAFSIPGTSFTDLDETQNQIVIGGVSEDTVKALKSAVMQIAVPGDAITYEIQAQVSKADC